MKENKYKILFFTLLGLLCGIIITGTIFFVVNTKQTDKNIVEKSNNEGSKDIKIEKGIEEITIEEDNNKPYINETYEMTNSTTKTYNEDITTNTDNEVLNYLSNKENEISSKIKDGTYKEKAKSIFIEIVDFLFYDGKIKGHSFSELTGKGKIEAIKIAIKIEDKIEQYQPGLINNIGSKYTNIKNKIIDLYEEKINEYCSNHTDLCSQVRNDYNNFKNSFKNAFNTVKNKISNFYQEKIKNNN